MYDPKTGAYTESINEFENQHLYIQESAYYLKYNSTKGLYAIEKICEKFEGNVQDNCFYHHVYLDLLFESVGMIINRFKPHSQAGEKIKMQAKNNCVEYEYNKENYPLLNDKSFRNFIEHIDEKDEILIENKNYYGTFNLVYEGMDDKIKNDLLSKEKQQNNLLNLEDMTYTILDSNKGKEIFIEKKVIDIKELKFELSKINDISNKIWSYLHMI